MAPHQSDSSSVSSSLRSAGPIIYLVCLIAFFIDFRPGEPFLTPYLIDDKGLGADNVNEKVYPLWTYSYFAFLIPVGVISDRLGYRVMIACQLLCLIVTYLVLVWAESLALMQFMQVTFGFASACHTCVFFTFIYKCCHPRLYHRVNAYQRSAALIGHVIGAISGQVLVTLGIEKWQLFFITFISFLIGFIIFLILPKPALSTLDELSGPPLLGAPVTRRHNRSFKQLLTSVKSQYSQYNVSLFSLYLILGNGALELVLNYDTTLFYEIDSSANYNGLVLGVGWTVAAMAAFAPSIDRVQSFVSKHSTLTLTVLPLTGSLLLLLSSYTHSIVLAYLYFDLFYALMSFLLSWSCGMIASSMSVTIFSLLFAFNTFLSLAVQSLIQFLIGEWAFQWNIREKYQCFAAQLLVVSAVFAVIGVWNQMKAKTALPQTQQQSASVPDVSANASSTHDESVE